MFSLTEPHATTLQSGISICKVLLSVLARDSQATLQLVTLITLKGEFSLSSNSPGELEQLWRFVDMFLEGIKARSQYALALQDSNRQGKRTGHSYEHAPHRSESSGDSVSYIVLAF